MTTEKALAEEMRSAMEGDARRTNQVRALWNSRRLQIIWLRPFNHSRGFRLFCLICKAAGPLRLGRWLNILTSQSRSLHHITQFDDCLTWSDTLASDHSAKNIIASWESQFRCVKCKTKYGDLRPTHSEEGFSLCQVPEDHGEDDSSEKTPSKASKSPQKTTKHRPKTVPVKVTLLDGSDYEAAVEVCHSLVIVR